MLTRAEINLLESKVELVKIIGREIKSNGESRINVDSLMSDESGNYSDSTPRYKAFEYLQDVGYIVAYDQTLGGNDGNTTFVKCQLTSSGERLYGAIENGYRSFIEGFGVILEDYDPIENNKNH